MSTTFPAPADARSATGLASPRHPASPDLPDAPAAATALLQFNIDLLEQAAGIAAAFRQQPDRGQPGGGYGEAIGPHIRHVLEHHEALVRAAATGVVDYDRRRRDPVVERDPVAALARLRGLQAALARWTDLEVDAEVEVRLLGGTGGEQAFAVRSTLGRELLFVASHAVHHYALLVSHCRALGIVLADGFGVAPATVAHWRGNATAAAGVFMR